MSNRYFISGATGGLGKAFAVECARRGWDLFLTDLDQAGLETLSEGLRRSYLIDVDYLPADLTDLPSRENLLSYVDSLGLAFRGLINVAGLDFEGEFLEISRPSLRTILRLNIESTLEITHYLLSRASSLIPFRVINVASLAAFYPMPIKATYAASKSFLLNFSLALREELRDQNATVTVLCPAGLPTKPTTIRSIKAQGAMGAITTENIGAVVNYTLDMALKGKAVVIPGFINRCLMTAGSLMPGTLLAHLIHKRWRSAKEKKQATKLGAESLI